MAVLRQHRRAALHRPGAVRLRHRRRVCGAGIDDRVLSAVPGAAAGRAFAGGRQLSAVGAGRAGAAVCRGGGIAVHPGQPPLGRAPGGADAGPADGQPGGCIFCRADDRKPVFAGDCALRAGVGSAAVGPLCGAGCAGWVVPRPRRTAAGAGGAGTGGRMAPGKAARAGKYPGYAGPGGGAGAVLWAEPGSVWSLEPVQRIPVGALGPKTGPVYQYRALPFGLYGQLVGG